MKILYTITGLLTAGLMFACGWLYRWYTGPLGECLCLSGLPPEYQKYWGAIWQTVKLGGIVGLALLAAIAILLIVIVARQK